MPHMQDVQLSGVLGILQAAVKSAHSCVTSTSRLKICFTDTSRATSYHYYHFEEPLLQGAFTSPKGRPSPIPIRVPRGGFCSIAKDEEDTYSPHAVQGGCMLSRYSSHAIHPSLLRKQIVSPLQTCVSTRRTLYNLCFAKWYIASLAPLASLCPRGADYLLEMPLSLEVLTLFARLLLGLLTLLLQMPCSNKSTRLAPLDNLDSHCRPWWYAHLSGSP